MFKKALFVATILPILFCVTAQSEQYWLTLNSADLKLSDQIKTRSHAEFRFPEAEYNSYFRLSQKLYTKLGNKWTLGSHPTIEGSRSRGVSNYKNTYRIDLELNPAKFTLGENGPVLSMRNRWELRWKEGKGSEIFNRVRQYTTLTWKLDAPKLDYYRIGNEIFYEIDKSLITMNRFYPLVLGVPLSKHFSTSLFYMYQRKRVGTSNQWGTSHIFGTSLKF